MIADKVLPESQCRFSKELECMDMMFVARSCGEIKKTERILVQ